MPLFYKCLYIGRLSVEKVAVCRWNNAKLFLGKNEERKTKNAMFVFQNQFLWNKPHKVF